MRTMINYKPSDIVLVPFPFTDLTTTKKRPAVVISTISPKKFSPICVVAIITSKVDSEEIDGDVRIEEWNESGLLHPSKIRLAKIVSVEAEIIFSKLGSLPKKEWSKTQKALKKLFQL